MVKISDPSAKKLQFTWSTDWLESRDTFHDILGGNRSGNDSDKQRIENVAFIVFNQFLETYMQKLASATKTKVMGGLPGTYSDLDASGPKNQQFLHVPLGAATGDSNDFSRALKFYSDQRGITFEPTKFGGRSPFGRGFAWYTP
jgi:hypothetical protein